MKNFYELIEFMKKVKRETPDSECACGAIELESGTLEVFKLSNSLTANLTFLVEGKEAKIQIEARGEDRVAVCPPNGTERSVEPCYYNMDDSFDSLRNLKAEKELIDMLINSLEGLHENHSPAL